VADLVDRHRRPRGAVDGLVQIVHVRRVVVGAVVDRVAGAVAAVGLAAAALRAIGKILNRYIL
jgi:hypothetical protein